MKRANLKTVIGAAFTMAGLIGACSLGDGVTPDCDATLPPSDPNAPISNLQKLREIVGK